MVRWTQEPPGHSWSAVPFTGAPYGPLMLGAWRAAAILWPGADVILVGRLVAGAAAAVLAILVATVVFRQHRSVTASLIAVALLLASPAAEWIVGAGRTLAAALTASAYVALGRDPRRLILAAVLIVLASLAKQTAAVHVYSPRIRRIDALDGTDWAAIHCRDCSSRCRGLGRDGGGLRWLLPPQFDANDFEPPVAVDVSALGPAMAGGGANGLHALGRIRRTNDSQRIPAQGSLVGGVPVRGCIRGADVLTGGLTRLLHRCDMARRDCRRRSMCRVAPALARSGAGSDHGGGFAEPPSGLGESSPAEHPSKILVRRQGTSGVGVVGQRAGPS